MSRFFASSYLEITPSTSSGKYRVAHQLSGKVLEVGELVVEAIQLFQGGCEIKELSQQMNLNPEDVEQLAASLRQAGIICDDSEQLAEVMEVVPMTPRILGLQGASWNEIANAYPLVGIPFGKGNIKMSGTEKMSGALRELSQKFRLDFGAGMKGINLNFLGSPAHYQSLLHLLEKQQIRDMGDIHIDPMESSQFVYQKIEAIASRLWDADARPIFIGGDHSITFSILKAASKKYENLHVIHFDAHTDNYSSPYDRLSHDKKVQHHGNFVKYALQEKLVNQFTQIGIRGFANSTQQEQEGQQIIWYHEALEMLESNHTADLPSDVPYYVTFDVDVLAPHVLAGTATPLAEGFTLSQARRLISRLLKGKNIVGIDIVEGNPSLDETTVSTQVTLLILLELMNCLPLDPEK